MLGTGEGDNFPAPTAGRFYWVDVGDGGCASCVRVKVLSRNGDTLVVEPPPSGQPIPRGRVSYATNSPEHLRALASEVGLEAVWPLQFDCVTRRLWIDCEGLKDLVAQPCAQ